MATGANAPVIIKRKKVIAGGGHHGGAWKVAMDSSFRSCGGIPAGFLENRPLAV
jgi:chemotaxis protein MotB